MFLSKEVKFTGFKNLINRGSDNSMLLGFISVLTVFGALIGAVLFTQWLNRVATDSSNSSFSLMEANYIMIATTAGLISILAGVVVPVLYGIKKGARFGLKVVLYEILFSVLGVAVIGTYSVLVHPAPTEPTYPTYCSGPLDNSVNVTEPICNVHD